jgi:hypothetical protein
VQNGSTIDMRADKEHALGRRLVFTNAVGMDALPAR